MLTQMRNYIFSRDNHFFDHYDIEKGTKIFDINFPQPISIRYTDQPPRNEPNSYIDIKSILSGIPCESYEFNFAERWGNRLLTPLAKSIDTIEDEDSLFFAKSIAVISFIFAAVIGLVGAAIKEAGEYFNPNKANYQTARQALANLEEAQSGLVSIDKEILDELERGASLKATPERNFLVLQNAQSALIAYLERQFKLTPDQANAACLDKPNDGESENVKEASRYVSGIKQAWEECCNTLESTRVIDRSDVSASRALAVRRPELPAGILTVFSMEIDRTQHELVVKQKEHQVTMQKWNKSRRDYVTLVETSVNMYNEAIKHLSPLSKSQK
ncbi:MAG: hypothetical protein ACHQUC_09070 [Chlamydiales bacterium]